MRTLTGFAALLLTLPTLAQKPPTITEPAWQRARAVWFAQAATPRIAAEVGLGYESLAWNVDTAKIWDTATDGQRLPLATAAWATLETFTDLQFGDTAVKAGNYYAVLAKGADGWLLGLLDCDKVRAAQIEPGIGGKEPLVASIPLTTVAGEDGAVRAEWTTVEDGAELKVQYGPHTLTARAKVEGAENAFPLAQPLARACSRASFVNSKPGKAPFAVIDHGAPKWAGAMEKTAKGMQTGERWRLGSDWATTLDTNTSLGIGGKKLPAGSWHLTLAKAAKDGWTLVVSSAVADHKAKIDGYNPAAVTPVLEIPLQRSTSKAAAEVLRVAFESAGGKAQFVIAFGTTRLTAVVAPM
jgi:hypothetical protein